jgi:hypothetical protein
MSEGAVKPDIEKRLEHGLKTVGLVGGPSR